MKGRSPLGMTDDYEWKCEIAAQFPPILWTGKCWKHCGFQIPCWSKYMPFHSEYTFLCVCKWFILLVNLLTTEMFLLAYNIFLLQKKKKRLFAIFNYNIYLPLFSVATIAFSIYVIFKFSQISRQRKKVNYFLLVFKN